MRITGGKARGIHLKTPRSLGTRPAPDALREALFSSLGSTVTGSRFADLFAGSGSYGLEAWSRGAAAGCFVETDSACGKSLRENIRQVAKSADLDRFSVSFVRSDVFKWRPDGLDHFDLVFADPPYDMLPRIEDSLFNLAFKLLSPAGFFVLEKPAQLQLEPKYWTVERQFGKKRGRGPSLMVYKKTSSSDLTAKD